MNLTTLRSTARALQSIVNDLDLDLDVTVTTDASDAGSPLHISRHKDSGTSYLRVSFRPGIMRDFISMDRSYKYAGDARDELEGVLAKSGLRTEDVNAYSFLILAR